MPLQISNHTLILDASCLITLYASRQMAEVLWSISQMVTVTTYVFKEEALFVGTAPNEMGVRGRAKIDLQPFVDAGLLHLVDIQSDDEAEEYTTLATQKIGKGEAMTGAIAIKRLFATVIDDKKARQVLAKRASHLELLHSIVNCITAWVCAKPCNTGVIWLRRWVIRRVPSAITNKASK